MLLRLISFIKTRRKLVVIFVSFCVVVFLFFWTTPVIDTSGTIKIWDRNHMLLYQSAGTVGSKIPVSYDRFPKPLIDATVASEDETFWKNPGIDIPAMARSFLLDIQEKRIVSGASTITQQLARASIVSQNETFPQSVVRKIREVLMALRLNLSYSKKAILTMYLNQMYYGNLSYGVQAASRRYFNKDVSELSVAESAFLAGLLSSPNTRDPFEDLKSAKKRQKEVLNRMVKAGDILPSQAERAAKEQLSFSNHNSDIKAPHFVDYVLGELRGMKIQTKQGINIYTTLDYPTYELSLTIARLWIERLKDVHDVSNASLVLLKNSTGEIFDMLGGIDYFDAKDSGQVNMTVALRQPGSALKPVTYAAAFEKGYTPATLIYDVPKVFTTKKGEGYTPNNYDGRYHGMVLARTALASSLNLPAVEMLSRVGIPSFLQTAHRLGITTLNQENRYDLSLTLGGGEVKLLDLTNVFASFARGGDFLKPFAIVKITTDDGKVLYQHKPENPVQAFSKNGQQIAYLISNILSDPQARILGFYEKNPLVLSRPAAVKTGTTTDWHDNWTVGYTPSYTVGVWVGNNDNHAMREITGVTGAAPIWNQFFEEFLKGKPVEDFKQPSGIKTVQICETTGLLPDNLCPSRRNELFIDGTQPTNVTSIYKKVAIDTRNNLLAGPMCPSEFVKDEILIDYPPQVYSWAVQNNQNVLPRMFSPLCSQTASDSNDKRYIELVYPKAKTVFQNAPEMVANQGVVFQANVSQSITKILWYVDGKIVGTVSQFPFTLSWYPQNGSHTVQATGIDRSGKKISSRRIPFSVIPYEQ